MRDIPVQMFVLRGKNRGAHYFRGCLTGRGGLMCRKFSGGQDAPEPPGRKGQKTGNPQKKEEPRGNGARSGEKQ